MSYKTAVTNKDANGEKISIAPNGMNFLRSMKNPNSRIRRIRQFLIENGPSTKRTIFRFVFEKDIDEVGRNWGLYPFTHGIHNGLLTKERVGVSVYYNVPDPSVDRADAFING